MSKLEMQQCVLEQVFTNCYFLKNKETGELLIVDPGDYAEKVFQKVALMQGKPVAEQEIGKQLLLETAAYAESSVCRRKSLLHYFGEEFTVDNF